MPKDVLEKTVIIAKQAGEIVQKYYQSVDLQVTEKSPDNPLSEADTACDSYLKQALLRLFPEAGWLSEETVDSPDRLFKEYVWIVDPIDGTKEFISRIPEFTIAIGLCRNGQTVLGVIHNPVSQETYFAGENTGVFLNNKERSVSRETKLKKAMVEASNSELKRGEFDSFIDIVGEIKPMGSIAYKLARLSVGKSDATWSRGPKSLWDICAGVHLVKQAGGKMSDLDGNDFIFNSKDVLVNGLIATNGALFDDVFQALLPYRDSARM